ncbi:MAG TPA: thiol-disulfide isomerase [Blastocatellia bacterium]|nr:thiol-disulfide isomerase [Blastocatellia bacterium]HMY74588.1 thiol-disulfide isomerase [Blastocatellia bacterium]HNG32720.1 thiol-disulfide isomerase [Blastocatellia bacterium]
MKRSYAFLLVLALGLSLFVAQQAGTAKEKTVTAATATYTKDVAPILYAKCAVCHHPGEAAPMSLMNYKEVRPWAKSIREKVVSREMPPWYADPNHGEFRNDARLTADQIEAIKAWVEGGSKEGDAKDLPAAPKFSETGWKFGQPDVVLEMTEEATIPADGTIPYKYYAIPTNFTEDKYIQFAEIKRGEPSVVHHVIINVREPEMGPLPPAGEIKANTQRVNPEQRQQNQGGQGGQGGQRRGNSSPDGMLVGWAPGMDPLTLQPGNAKLIKKGSVLVFQMHYTSTGVAATDRTKVGLWFAKKPVEKRLITHGVFVDPSRLVIPAGDPNFESRSSFTFKEDVHIHMFMPHMHVRGKDFEYKLVYPDGKEKILLKVPKYDFNWQLTYFVKEPIAVPKGSRIECVAHHDNSANNKFNPDPSITVRWGDQTWEEMMIGWLDYTIDNQDLRAQQTASK